PRRRGRSPRHLVAALGADARAARRARAGVRAAARAPFGLRPAAGGGLQVRRHPQARSLERRDRRGATASERSAYRRRRERRAHRDQAAVASPRRPPGDRKLYRQIPETGMNKDLLSVDEALQLLLSKAWAVVDIKTLPVCRRIRLGLFFTGDELVMPGEPLAPGRIYNSNRFTLRGLAEVFGCEVRDYGIVPDSLDATREVLRRAAAECDLIVT